MISTSAYAVQLEGLLAGCRHVMSDAANNSGNTHNLSLNIMIDRIDRLDIYRVRNPNRFPATEHMLDKMRS